MTVQARNNIDTTPFVLFTMPGYRQDNAVIEQDAGRVADLLRYTLMAKKPVDVATDGVEDVGNTGDGTVSAVAAALGGFPLVGSYELEVTAAVVNGGVFKLTDPNGNIVASELVMQVGAGAATVFVVGGLTFTITDGATDFIVGDKFTIAVTANGKYVPFNIASVGGGNIPLAIFMGDDIATATLVAGDVIDQPMIFTGIKFDEGKLVFDDGASTLDTVLPNGKSIRDELHDLGLIPTQTQSASRYENE